MMTIKIILVQTEQDEKPTTYLFEAEYVFYKSIHFKDKDNFVKKYNKATGHLGNILVYGIPDHYWKEKEKVEANTFLCIYYGRGDKLESCIVLQNANAYIMQGGQTVDKIHC